MIAMWSKGRSPTLGQSDGFTLLEVVIAVAILALALVTLLQTQNGNIALVVELERMTTATLLAQRHMTELTMGDLPALGKRDGNFADEENGDELSLYRWAHRVVGTGHDRFRQVEVTVSWEPHTAAHSVILVTYVAGQEHGESDIPASGEHLSAPPPDRGRQND